MGAIPRDRILKDHPLKNTLIDIGDREILPLEDVLGEWKRGFTIVFRIINVKWDAFEEIEIFVCFFTVSRFLWS